jgi:hypothetical protein
MGSSLGSDRSAAFPLRGWTAATRRVLAAARPERFGGGDPQGRFELRAALAELYQDPDEARQGLLIGYAGPTERGFPAALEALAGTLRAVGF